MTALPHPAGLFAGSGSRGSVTASTCCGVLSTVERVPRWSQGGLGGDAATHNLSCGGPTPLAKRGEWDCRSPWCAGRSAPGCLPPAQQPQPPGPCLHPQPPRTPAHWDPPPCPPPESGRLRCLSAQRVSLPWGALPDLSRGARPCLRAQGARLPCCLLPSRGDPRGSPSAQVEGSAAPSPRSPFFQWPAVTWAVVLECRAEPGLGGAGRLFCGRPQLLSMHPQPATPGLSSAFWGDAVTLQDGRGIRR